MSQFDLAMGRALSNELGESPITVRSLAWRGYDAKGKKPSALAGFDPADDDGNGVVPALDAERLGDPSLVKAYRDEWWDRYRYGQLDPQPVGDKMLATAVQISAPNANRCMQRALVAHGREIKVDGNLSQETMKAIRYVCAKHTFIPLLATLRAEIAAFHREIVALNPKLAKHLPLWLQRSYAAV